MWPRENKKGGLHCDLPDGEGGLSLQEASFQGLYSWASTLLEWQSQQGPNLSLKGPATGHELYHFRHISIL